MDRHSSEGDSNGEKATRYPMVNVRGLLMPEPFLNMQVIHNLLDYKPRDTDIFIVTYPKCGTTWTQFLVWEVMHKGEIPPSPNQVMFHDVPFLEYIDVNSLSKLPHPRAMKTHLAFNLQPYNSKSKYIYVVRNPYDCCVSYYYHNELDPALPHFSFDDYFELFIKGDVPWGDFFDHVLSWYPHRNDANVLFLSYEEMKKDVRKVILKIAKFLGDSYFEDVLDEEVLTNCVRHSDFKYLKDLGMYFADHDGQNIGSSEADDIMKRTGEVDVRKGNTKDFKEVPFFRKGEVGDWKNHFSQSQLEKFNDYMKKKLRNTEMEGFWKPALQIDNETAL